MHQWNHPISLILRAREHALNVLSGVEGPQTRQHGHQKSSNQLGNYFFLLVLKEEPLC